MARIVCMFLAAALLATVADASPVRAAYPERPIHIVIPFGPGGLADITLRLLGQRLAERTGQQVVIENRPSAGSVLAAATTHRLAIGHDALSPRPEMR